MRLPVVEGLIERRILVNFRVDPAVLARQLPAPFRPKLVADHALAGICLIRLGDVRPRGLPRALGVSSENAAHRIAVQWDEDGVYREGVFVTRRDTNSRFNTWVGGRLFPGVHHHARIASEETSGRYRVKLDSDDRAVRLLVDAHVASEWPGRSVFPTLAEASAFFATGSLGYSPALSPGAFDGLELSCRTWSMTPLVVNRIESSIFADSNRFPTGSVEFDSALLMCNIPHEWRQRPVITNTPSLQGAAGTC
ncbi:MAG: DUF2071 domain-containing protein [Planctomycetes bacterium]|nr:DUF2071 domain-containing protein [Planctomycetota bacterium]